MSGAQKSFPHLVTCQTMSRILNLDTKTMRIITITSALLWFCLKAGGAEPSGNIAGKVTLAGPAPTETKINLTPHPKLEVDHPEGLMTRRFEVGETGGLRNVLVYLRGDFAGRKFELTEKPTSLEHAKGLFQPYVSGMQVGQVLQLQNTDNCQFHAVAAANKEFNYAFAKTHRFTAPEVPVKFKCELHPWNNAYVGVFSHPFFTTTDEDGSFKIGAVPPGRYTLEMFHPATGKTTKEVVVENEQTVKADFSVSAK
jgi:hypothetical protein